MPWCGTCRGYSGEVPTREPTGKRESMRAERGTENARPRKGRALWYARRSGSKIGTPCGAQRARAVATFIPGTQPARPCGGMRAWGGVWGVGVFCLLVCSVRRRCAALPARGGVWRSPPLLSPTRQLRHQLVRRSGAQRARSPQPMLLIGVSTAHCHSHHNHQLTDARTTVRDVRTVRAGGSTSTLQVSAP